MMQRRRLEVLYGKETGHEIGRRIQAVCIRVRMEGVMVLE